MRINEVTKGQAINGQSVKSVKISKTGRVVTVTLADGTSIRRSSVTEVRDGQIR